MWRPATRKKKEWLKFGAQCCAWIVARARDSSISVTPRQILQHRTIAAIFAELAKDAQNLKQQAQAIKPVAREKYRVTQQAFRHIN